MEHKKFTWKFTFGNFITALCISIYYMVLYRTNIYLSPIEATIQYILGPVALVYLGKAIRRMYIGRNQTPEVQ